MAWVDSANSVILIIAHKWHMLSLLLELGEVEEECWIKGAIRSVFSESGNLVTHIQAKLITIAHGSDEVLSD